MGTFKLQLTEEQWAAAMQHVPGEPSALHAALRQQQPELYARLESAHVAKFEAQKKQAEAAKAKTKPADAVKTADAKAAQ
jgi:hypothetical protein